MKKPTDGIKQRAIVSLASSYLSQFATTAASLVTKIVLARLIAPADLGTYSLALLALLAGDIVVDLGVSQHIAREGKRPYGTQLLLRMSIALGLYALLLAGASVFSYWSAELPAVIRVMSVVIVIKAYSGVPTLFLDRELLIHRSVAPQLARLLLTGVVSVALAALGMGVWAMAWGTIAGEAVYAVTIRQATRGRMRMEFTWRNTRRLIWSSRFLLLIAAIGFTLQQGDTAIVGSLLSVSQLGAYALAYTLITQVSKTTETAIYRVIYPMFCEHQESVREIGAIYHRATLAIVAVEAPIYFCLLFHGKTLSMHLFGPEWAQAGTIIQMLSLSGIVNPFSTFGYEVLRATRKDRVLTLSLAMNSAALLILGYALTSRYGVSGMVAANYAPLGAIPVIVSLYRTIRGELTSLARQLFVVYTTSLAAMALATALIPGANLSSALCCLLVPVCWYGYYRAYAADMGKETLRVLLSRSGTAESTA